MQICATLVCNTKNSDEQTIICVNYVLSGSQFQGMVMDSQQVDQPASTWIKKDTEEDPKHDSPESLKGKVVQNQLLTETDRKPVIEWKVKLECRLDKMTEGRHPNSWKPPKLLS